jgi:hypothetical protein
VGFGVRIGPGTPCSDRRKPLELDLF